MISTDLLIETINNSSDATREADDSICGYFYQINLTLYRILALSSKKSFFIEKIEDILEIEVQEKRIDISAIQIKYHKNCVTNSSTYKALLFGFLSYLSIKETILNKNKEVNYSLEVLFGTPQSVNVNKTEALDSILKYKPFNKNYKQFNANWIKSNPIYDEDTIQNFLKITEIKKEIDSDELTGKINEEIIRLQEELGPNDNLYSSIVIHSVMWSIIKDLIFSHAKNKIITKKILISKTIFIWN